MTYIGLDVQTRRGLPYAVVNHDRNVTDSGWISVENAVPELRQLVSSQESRPAVGIDAPRMPLPKLRTWSFVGGRWIRDREGKNGRHCELVIKKLDLANPQWTRLEEDSPGWMRLGFELFAAAESSGALVHEVFPTASYSAFETLGESDRVNLPLNNFRRGPKDMLDAVVAAYTVLRFGGGLGCEVGGGDGLGTIILPTPVEAHPISSWPG